MSISSNANRLWQSFTGKTKINPVNIVAQRFIQAFYDHGVQPSQIPRLLPQIKLDDLKSEEALLSALTPEVLDQAAHFFGIRSEWLEGVDDKIYECRSCYKQPELFFEHLATLRSDEHGNFWFPIRAISVNKNLDCGNPNSQPLALVLVEFIAWLGDERICRYHVYWDGWDWSYAPTRIQLKAMVRMASYMSPTVPIFTAKLDEVEKIIKGELIPRKIVDRGGLVTDPSLEDYSLNGGGIAKEVDELPAVFSYIEEHHLESLIAALSPKPNTPDEPASDIAKDEPPPADTVVSNATKAANAKNAPKNAIKARFVSFFKIEGDNHPNKKAAAEHFFDSLDEKQEKLLFDHKDAAIRTLLNGLRDHLKEAKPSK